MEQIFYLEFQFILVANQKNHVSHRDFLGSVIIRRPLETIEEEASTCSLTPAYYNHKPIRSSLPSYDSVIVIGENDFLPSYHEALALSRGTISLHM